MMQHVATAKSEVAAFATVLDPSSVSDSGENKNFGKMLQAQQDKHTLVDKAQTQGKAIPDKERGDKASSDTALMENKPLSEIKSDEGAIDADEPNSKLHKVTDGKPIIVNDKVANENEANDKENSDKEVESPIPAIVNISQFSLNKSVNNDLGSNKQSNIAADVELYVTNTLKPLLLPESPKEVQDNPENIDAQQWVALVHDLQKLAGVTLTQKQVATKENTQNSDLVNPDLKLPDDLAITEISAALESATALQIGADAKVAKGESSTQIDIQLGKIMAKQILDDVKTFSTTEELVQKVSELLDLPPKELKVNLSEKVQDVKNKDAIAVDESKLLGIDTIVENKGLFEPNQQENNGLVKLSQQESNGLVKLSQQESNGLVKLSQQESNGLINLSPIENNELLNLDLTESSELPDLNLKQTSELPDLSLEENKKLLMTLLSDPSGVKSTQDDLAALEVTQKITEELWTSHVNMPTDLEPSVAINVLESLKKPMSPEMKLLIVLPEAKLDKVLNNIAQRLMENQVASAPAIAEQMAQKAITPLTAELNTLLDSPSKSIAAILKTGVEEFKQQLASGREPGFDLKTLVADAVAQSPELTSSNKATIGQDQILRSVAQVLDFAHTLNQAVEHNQNQNYSANLREVTQIQGEQSKQVQLNQFESKFEKAVNINKPEGHQQLAEKVRWMVNTKNLIAEIRLDPADLGSVHVKVAMSGESATVNFVVQSQLARDAMDTAIPRLREMLAEKGIELGQSSVRQEDAGQQDQQKSNSANKGTEVNDQVEELDVANQLLGQQNIVNGALGGIDYFV
jgi:flagellar hook-length control protein FliK